METEALAGKAPTAMTGNAAHDTSSIERLLGLEAAAREVESAPELYYFIANETRKVLRYQQCVVARIDAGGKLSVSAVSSLSQLDQSSPFIVWIKAVLKRRAGDPGLDSSGEFSLADYSDREELASRQYPFLHSLWVPLSCRQTPLDTGMLLLRERPWDRESRIIAERLSATYGHALTALNPRRRHRSNGVRLSRPLKWASAVALIVAMFAPVSLTTLAPVEVVARDPLIVAAPVSAVIEEILVKPNEVVDAGDVLFRFNDTDFRNRYIIAQQEVEVAAARLRRSKKSAFNASEDAHDIVILQAELNQKQLQLNYAREQLEQLEVVALGAGVVLYSDADDFVGRPVAVGEQVMKIADPQRVELQIDVPVKDSVMLNSGAKIRAYLDSNPARPIAATLSSASYHAAATPQGTLAYRSVAHVSEDADAATMRIGLRGTARLYAQKVSLFYYLFRRPISAARQLLAR